MTPFCSEWDEKKAVPRELFKKAYEAGLLPGVVGAPWPEEYAGPWQGDGTFNHFHELILRTWLGRARGGRRVARTDGGPRVALLPAFALAKA